MREVDIVEKTVEKLLYGKEHNEFVEAIEKRIKKLKLVDLDTNEEWEQILEDTPNPQFVDCKGHEGNRIRAIIQDVYPGDLWKDTCVSGIILTN